MKKKSSLAFCIVIFMSALLPLAGYVIHFKTPNLDKSPLSPFPVLVDKNGLNLTFTTEFDNYFSDQFPFRSYMISAYSGINEYLLGQSGSEKVVVGKDGFLFFAETLDDYFKVNMLSDEDLIRLNNILGIQKDYLAKLGIPSYFMVVPNKATIYGEYMPSNMKTIGKSSNLDRLSELELAMPFIDLKTPLLAYKSGTDMLLYHAKDTHWNNLGAAVGYETMLKKIGQQSLSLLTQTPAVTMDWQGDLSRMLYPSNAIHDKQYNFVLPGNFTFTRAIRGFDDLEIESINPTKMGHLMMFRDSFTNALVPYLSDSFGQVDYLRVFPYDYRNVETLHPDALFIEIAERNIDWLLQSTPLLAIDPVEKHTSASLETKMSFAVEQSESSGYFYLNVCYDDQTVGKTITAVKIIANKSEYDAFPVYQDGNFEDGKIVYGFSIYTKEPIDLASSDVLIQIGGTWMRIVQ